MSDAMKALDEIEAAAMHMADMAREFDYGAANREERLINEALATLRAALTPPADDEVGAIRARHEHCDFVATKTEWNERAAFEAHTDRATLLALVDRLSAELAKAKERIVKLETPTLQWNPDSPETPIESVESLAEHFADYGHPCGVFEVQNAHELPYTYHFYNVMVDSQELDDDDPIETHEVVCREITKEEYRAGLAAAAIGWFAKRAKWATDRAATLTKDTP